MWLLSSLGEVSDIYITGRDRNKIQWQGRAEGECSLSMGNTLINK